MRENEKEKEVGEKKEEKGDKETTASQEKPSFGFT